MQRSLSSITAGLLVASTLAYGQATAGQNGWKRVGDSPQTPEDPSQVQGAYGAPAASGQAAPNVQGPYGNAPAQGPSGPTFGQRPAAQPPYDAPQTPVPPSLRVPSGTFVTVRTNGAISTGQNHTGDAFSATLAQPMVVNGVVISEPGQTISGQVVEAQRSGRIEGTARLRVQLTELTLVDGQQIPIRTQLIGRQAGTSVGRDAGAVAGTTGLGAAIGAAAGWGRGAAIGAGAGAAVGLLGVLLTRGHDSVIYPEETLTFRIEAPFTVDTERSAQAFRYVQPNEYNQPLYTQPQQAGPSLQNAPAPPPYYGAYPYYGSGYGYPYYGPSFSLFVGRGFYGPGWYGGRGYYGGRGWSGGRGGWRR